MADRFLLEARTAAQLSHPHIIPIHAVRTTGQLRYFAMKYIAGSSLDHVLAEAGPLPVAIVQAVLAQVGSALDHAHRRGVVHRDIKPANIMLDEDGRAIVADFGIAKVSQGTGLTQTGSTVGTPTYMSPEQCTGKPVTGASDQYALGCVAFELLAGRPPFAHQEVVPVLLAHVSEVPPPLLQFRPDCPIELAAVIDKMLAKNPAERWPSLAEAIAAAECAAAGVDVEVRERMRELASVDQDRTPPAGLSMAVSPLPSTGPMVTAPRNAAAPGAEVLTVSIQPNGAVLQAGAGLQLQAVARDRAGLPVPDAPIEWCTSAPGTVSVSTSGVVTARLEGEADVTARSGCPWAGSGSPRHPVSGRWGSAGCSPPSPWTRRAPSCRGARHPGVRSIPRSPRLTRMGSCTPGVPDTHGSGQKQRASRQRRSLRCRGRVVD
jgi:serine/threonine-protein kinase